MNILLEKYSKYAALAVDRSSWMYCDNYIWITLMLKNTWGFWGRFRSYTIKNDLFLCFISGFMDCLYMTLVIMISLGSVGHTESINLDCICELRFCWVMCNFFTQIPAIGVFFTLIAFMSCVSPCCWTGQISSKTIITTFPLISDHILYMLLRLSHHPITFLPLQLPQVLTVWKPLVDLHINLNIIFSHKYTH